MRNLHRSLLPLTFALLALFPFSPLAQQSSRRCDDSVGKFDDPDNECAPCTNNMEQLLHPVVDYDHYLQQIKTINDNLDAYLSDQQSAIDRLLERNDGLSLSNWSARNLTEGPNLSNDLEYIDYIIAEMEAYRERFEDYPAQSSWMANWIQTMQGFKQLLQTSQVLNQRAEALTSKIRNGDYGNLSSLNYDCCPKARREGAYNPNQLSGLAQLQQDLQALLNDCHTYRSDMADQCAHFTEMLKTTLNSRAADSQEMEENRDQYADGMLSFLIGKLVDEMKNDIRYLIQSTGTELSTEQEALVQHLSEALGDKVEGAIGGGAQSLATGEAARLLSEALGEMSETDRQAFEAIAGPVMDEIAGRVIEQAAARMMASATGRFFLQGVGGAVTLPLALFDKLVTVPLYLWAERDLLILQGAYDRILIAEIIALRMSRDRTSAAPASVLEAYINALKGERNRAIEICLEPRTPMPQTRQEFADAFLNVAFSGNTPPSWAENDHFDLVQEEGLEHTKTYLHYVMHGMRFKVRFNCFCGIFLDERKSAYTPDPTSTSGSLPSSLYVQWEGTGETTGLIARATLTNLSGTMVQTTIGPGMLVPKAGRQHYILPHGTPVSLQPMETVSVLLPGYCTNVDMEPVPNREDFGHGMQYYPHGQADPAPRPGWHPPNGFAPLSAVSPVATIPTLPGTNTPFPYLIETQKFPERVTNLFIESANLLEASYNHLTKENGWGLPPVDQTLSGQKALARAMTFPQQNLWRLSAALNGEEYGKDDFAKQYIEQIEERNNQPAASFGKVGDEKVSQNAANIWDNLQLTGLHAKVLATPDKIEKTDAFGFWQDRLEQMSVNPPPLPAWTKTARELEACLGAFNDDQVSTLSMLKLNALVAVVNREISICQKQSPDVLTLTADITALLNSPLTLGMPPVQQTDLEQKTQDLRTQYFNYRIPEINPENTASGMELAALMQERVESIPPKMHVLLISKTQQWLEKQLPSSDGVTLLSARDILHSPNAVYISRDLINRKSENLSAGLNAWLSEKIEALPSEKDAPAHHILAPNIWLDKLYYDITAPEPLKNALSMAAAEWFNGQLDALPKDYGQLVELADLLGHPYWHAVPAYQKEKLGNILQQQLHQRTDLLSENDEQFLTKQRLLLLDIQSDYAKDLVPDASRDKMEQQLAQKLKTFLNKDFPPVTAIKDPGSIDLTGRLWKAPAAVPPGATVQDNPYPWYWWTAIPVVGGITYWLLSDKDDTPADIPPQANDDQITVYCPQPVNINVLANDQGKNLTVTSINAPTGIAVENMGNGLLQINQVLTAPISFSYAITDEQQRTDQALVTINVIPPPLAPANDAFSMNYGETLNGQVLDNDIGIGLLVTAFTQPQGGGLVMSEEGVFSLSNNACQALSFSYTVTDQCLQQALATVEINIVLPPVAAMDDAFSTQTGQAVDGNVLSNDLGQNLTVVDFTQPAGGGLTLGADGNFTLNPQVCQDATFTYTVADVCQQQATANVSIAINPGLLQANEDIFPAEAGQPLSGNVLQNDVGGGLKVQSFTQPATGDLSLEDNGNFLFSPQDCEPVTFAYTVVDACNQTQTANVTLNYTDNTPPTIDCPPAITLECGADPDPVTTGTAEAADFCTPDLNPVFTDETDGSACTQIITRTWTAIDQAGNSASCSQLITIQDTQIPSLNGCPGSDLTAPCDDIPEPPAVSATDNCQSDPAIVFTEDTLPAQQPAELFRLRRTWTANDGCNNTASCAHTLQVTDDQAPTLACPADIEISCDQQPLPGLTGTPSVTDNCTGNPELEYADNPDGLSGCNQTGILVRTWTATDQTGNTTSCSQNIAVVDNTPPVWSLCPVDIDVLCGQQNNLSLTGIAVPVDNCTPGLVASYLDDLTGLNGCTGTLVRIWSAVDSCGNAAPSCQQTIAISPADCLFEPFLDITPANCGDDDGIVAIGMSPPGNYAFTWSDGFIGPVHFNLTGGNYTVTIEDAQNYCTEVIPVVVPEIPPAYIDEITPFEASCPETGNINLVLNASGPTNYDIVVTGPVNLNLVNIPPGNIHLADFGNIPAGEYIVEVQSAGSCSEVAIVVVPYIPPYELALVEFSNPTCPSCNDGSAFFFVGTGAALPLQVVVNGTVIGTVSDYFFGLNNLPEGAYNVLVVDANGCPSNEVGFTLMAQQERMQAFWQPDPFGPSHVLFDKLATEMAASIPEHPAVEHLAAQVLWLSSPGASGLQFPSGRQTAWQWMVMPFQGVMTLADGGMLPALTPFRGFHQQFRFVWQGERVGAVRPLMYAGLAWDQIHANHTRPGDRESWIRTPYSGHHLSGFIQAGMRWEPPGKLRMECLNVWQQGRPGVWISLRTLIE